MREGRLNLEKRPGNSTGVHEFSVALLRQCAHTPSLKYKTVKTYSKRLLLSHNRR